MNKPDRLWSPQMRKWMGDARQHGMNISVVRGRGAAGLLNGLLDDGGASFGAFLLSETDSNVLVPDVSTPPVGQGAFSSGFSNGFLV